jgi:hypothetical protein
VPAEFGVQGFFFRYEHHAAYWRRLAGGRMGIVAMPARADAAGGALSG